MRKARWPTFGDVFKWHASVTSAVAEAEARAARGGYTPAQREAAMSLAMQAALLILVNNGDRPRC